MIPTINFTFKNLIKKIAGLNIISIRDDKDPNFILFQNFLIFLFLISILLEKKAGNIIGIRDDKDPNFILFQKS